MLSNETIEKLSDILVKRIEDVNTFTLQEIAKSLKTIKDLTPSEAIKLIKIFKYGGDYDKIRRELKKATNINLKDIDKIFKEVAKKNQQFAKQFYDYRNVKFIPYDENIELQRQVEAIATITKKDYLNISKTIGFTRIVKGKRIFTELSKYYEECIDEAIISVVQGKSTTDEVIRQKIEELSASGLKVIDYGTTYVGKDGKTHHYVRRLDSAVRMNVLDGVRNVVNETNMTFGKEFDYDGVEITVHEAPAPDHADVQGRQFEKEQFDNFQNDKDAHDIKGRKFDAEYSGHDRRSISQYNCYHNAFPIVIGVSEAQYTDKELDDIKKRNLKGFSRNGKHYTLYQGTQMQRQLETEIRKAKDLQIMAVETDDEDTILKAQRRISKLNARYKELCNQSGLTARKERMRVSGYRRRSVK